MSDPLQESTPDIELDDKLKTLAVMQNRTNESELRIARRTFEAFDADGSGTIDCVELQAVMQSMGHELSDAQLRELVDQVDADGSGDITLEEFIHLIGLWKEVNRFKVFRSNSHSLQEARILDASRTRLLLPDSYPIVAWHFCVLLAVVYSYIITGYLIASLTYPSTFYEIKNATSDAEFIASAIFAIDVIITFVTAVRVSYNGPSRTLVLDSPVEVAMTYILSPWLIIDIVAIPPALIFLSRSQSYYGVFFILLKALKIPKLFRRSGKRNMTPRYVYLHFYLIPAIRYLVYFVLWAHSIAVIWTVVSIYTTPPIPTATVATASSSGSAGLGTLPSSQGQKVLQVDLTYINAIYFVITTLTTNGYGDVPVLGSDIRVIIACILCVCGTLLTGIVIGSIVSIISRTNVDTERKTRLLEVAALCAHLKLPNGLVTEILNFQNHLLADSFSDAYDELVAGLPAVLKENIGIFARVNLVTDATLFKDAHPGVKVAICAVLTSIVFRPETEILIAGEQNDCMYFIAYGFVEVLSRNGLSLAVLKRGECFGEDGLLNAAHRQNVTIKTITYCDLFQLPRKKFETVLQRFPAFRKAMASATSARSSMPRHDDQDCPIVTDVCNTLNSRIEEQDARRAMAQETSQRMRDTFQQLSAILLSCDGIVSELSRRKEASKLRGTKRGSLSDSSGSPVSPQAASLCVPPRG